MAARRDSRHAHTAGGRVCCLCVRAGGVCTRAAGTKALARSSLRAEEQRGRRERRRRGRGTIAPKVFSLDATFNKAKAQLTCQRTPARPSYMI